MHLVVIGGGHAGIEAAYIAARMGMPTTLVTLNLDQIGQLSCNPSIGGVGKGHMVRELDVLGGAMARLTDATGIHFRILNASRGVAVRGPRAQVDRVSYRLAARSLLERTPNLRLRQGLVTRIVWEAGTKGLKAIELEDGSRLDCDAVVLAGGTFLNGQVLVGERRTSSGRAGEPASTHLAQQLRALGLEVRRLKTGTSPRIAQASVELDQLLIQPGDDPPRPFSFFSARPVQRQVPCHITHTTAATEAIVRENLRRSSMYGGHIDGIGPRYCPSIEDKFVKFPHKGHHQIFVEPDSLNTRELYLAGMSTSMPVDVQEQMVRSLPGFGAAEILRPGYAIEYDAFDPLQLKRDLSFDGLEGLWMAGQVNGTTGYEEAAGQGLLAGINAVRWLVGGEPLVLGRHQAYIGVMIDDLVTKGADEPYRMLTARAENRLGLACDRADERLLPIAEEIGAHSPEELALLARRIEHRQRVKQACDAAWVTPTSQWGGIASEAGLDLTRGMSLSDLFKRQQITEDRTDACLAMLPEWFQAPDEWDPALERDLLVYDARYSDFREREARLLSGQRSWDHVLIPVDLHLDKLHGLSHEVREKLSRHKPETLGQASRIPGVTHAAVSLLHMLIRQRPEVRGS